VLNFNLLLEAVLFCSLSLLRGSVSRCLRFALADSRFLSRFSILCSESAIETSVFPSSGEVGEKERIRGCDIRRFRIRRGSMRIISMHPGFTSV